MGTLVSALVGHRLVALDTFVWIHHFEGSSAFGTAVESVLESIARGRVAAAASELALLELVVAPLRKGAQDVADEIELLLLYFPNLQLVPITCAVLARGRDPGAVRDAHAGCDHACHRYRGRSYFGGDERCCVAQGVWDRDLAVARPE